jgi:hypothetical protein
MHLYIPPLKGRKHRPGFPENTHAQHASKAGGWGEIYPVGIQPEAHRFAKTRPPARTNDTA